MAWQLTLTLIKDVPLIYVMGNSFVFLHGSFIFIHLVAHISENLTTFIIAMLIFNMSLQTGTVDELETEFTLNLGPRI